MEAHKINHIILLVSALIGLIVNIYALRTTSYRFKMTAPLVKKQTTLYILTDLALISYTATMIYSYTHEPTQAVSVVVGCSYGVAELCYWLGLWHFSFTNWIVSREVPKFLVRSGVVTDKR
jgi:hypothetical protein